MRLFNAVILAFSMFVTNVQGASQQAAVERQNWKIFFEQHNAEGTLVVLDQRAPGAVFQVHNPRRASAPYLPASTYKIPHALFALEHGVVKDEFQVFKWDGKTREFDVWNSDHNLRSSMRGSVVWVYQRIGQEIGEQAAKTYLEKADYGNADPSGGKDGYWLDGNIRINAFEQIQFLQKLYTNSLPFKVEHQRLVKDIIIVEAGKDWILRGKTGWEGSFGWWVGYVEWPTGPVFFALNIDTPNRIGDLPKREAVTRAVLQSIKALPPS
ncbi:class D beta-lactamase [Limnobacter alexandrii]|uniref:class D beta-lactamase n=1 Tax=Limnobacter alexandrii TaxID=2570352 RepID=UPI001BB0DD89|nr:class D beta-lactamase [Limnobacter alexandrii]